MTRAFAWCLVLGLLQPSSLAADARQRDASVVEIFFWNDTGYGIVEARAADDRRLQGLNNYTVAFLDSAGFVLSRQSLVDRVPEVHARKPIAGPLPFVWGSDLGNGVVISTLGADGVLSPTCTTFDMGDFLRYGGRSHGQTLLRSHRNTESSQQSRDHPDER